MTIPPPVFFSIVGLLTAAFLGTIAVIHGQTDPTPRAVMTPQQHADFTIKRNSLANARALRAAGRYDETIKTYDQLLKRYPNSITAQQGRAEAVKALEAQRAKTTVTARAAKQTKVKETSPAPEKKPSLWQRIFRRNRTKAAAPTGSQPTPAKPPLH